MKYSIFLLVLGFFNLGVSDWCNSAFAAHNHHHQHDHEIEIQKIISQRLENGFTHAYNTGEVLTLTSTQNLELQKALMAAVAHKIDDEFVVTEPGRMAKVKEYVLDWLSHLNPKHIYQFIAEQTRRRGLAFGISFAVSELTCQGMLYYGVTHPTTLLGVVAGAAGASHVDDFIVLSSWFWGPRLADSFRRLMLYGPSAEQLAFYRARKAYEKIDWSLDPFLYIFNEPVESDFQHEQQALLIINEPLWPRKLSKKFMSWHNPRAVAQEEIFPTLRFKDLMAIAAEYKINFKPVSSHSLASIGDSMVNYNFHENVARLFLAIEQHPKKSTILAQAYGLAVARLTKVYSFRPWPINAEENDQTTLDPEQLTELNLKHSDHSKGIYFLSFLLNQIKAQIVRTQWQLTAQTDRTQLKVLRKELAIWKKYLIKLEDMHAGGVISYGEVKAVATKIIETFQAEASTNNCEALLENDQSKF